MGDPTNPHRKQKRPVRKTARARTVLSEKQLNILKTCYSANPRPDALMKVKIYTLNWSCDISQLVYFSLTRGQTLDKLYFIYKSLLMTIKKPNFLLKTSLPPSFSAKLNI